METKAEAEAREYRNLTCFPRVTPSDSIKYCREVIERQEERIAELIQKIGGEPNYSI